MKMGLKRVKLSTLNPKHPLVSLTSKKCKNRNRIDKTSKPQAKMFLIKESVIILTLKAESKM